MSASAPFISVVVPVYNSAAAVSVVHRRLAAVLAQLAPPERGGYEIIFVDDASADGSWQAICKLHQAHHRPPYACVLGLRLNTNVGQHAATLCGLRQSHGQYIATLDDDLQQPPEALPTLLEALDAQAADIVYGNFRRPRRSAGRLAASRLLRAGSKLAYGRSQLGCSFRILRRRALPPILNYQHPLVSLEDIIYPLPLRLAFVPIENQPSILGGSRHSNHSLALYSLKLLVWYTALPLYAVWAAAALLLLSAPCFVLLGSAPLGNLYAFMATVGGLMLAGIGLMGIYLRGLMTMNQQAPQYVISDQLPA